MPQSNRRGNASNKAGKAPVTKFARVSVRLWPEDLDKIKTAAAAEELQWQHYFRRWVHRMLSGSGRGKVA